MILANVLLRFSKTIVLNVGGHLIRNFLIITRGTVVRLVLPIYLVRLAQTRRSFFKQVTRSSFLFFFF